MGGKCGKCYVMSYNVIGFINFIGWDGSVVLIGLGML